MDAFDNLKNAIVQQAAEDYAAAFMGSKVGGKEPEDMMRECEQFFHSGWYTELTNGAIDGGWLARNVKIRELRKAVKVYDAMLNICNSTIFRATVTFPKEKGKEKPKPMNYTFPPRFAGAIRDTLRIQLETIKAEIRELETKNKGVGV